MGASAMNAKKKSKRRRHAKTRKAARDAIAEKENRPQPTRRPS